MSISGFLAASAQRKFVWGQDDCALWIADLVRQETGFDPARRWRGTYSTARGCYRTLKAAGGLEALVTSEMCHPDLHALSGDGVVIAKVGRREFCGVLHNGYLFARTALTVRILENYEVKAGWSW